MEVKELSGREKSLQNLTKKGLGRKKGSKNKIPADVRQAFLETFNELGGTQGLTAWALENPSIFYQTISKMVKDLRPKEDEQDKPEVIVNFINTDKPHQITEI